MFRGSFQRIARTGLAGVALLAAVGLPMKDALAVPAFARQTGQNCVACHAGGQFPELTPYGRIFKLTGYTLGTRGLPLSVMAVATYTKTKNTDTTPNGGTPATDFVRDGSPIFNTASLFLAGKITDNIGGFAQFTFNNYDDVSADGTHFRGHSSSDNFDVRYADRFIDTSRDLIFGFTLNNNPSVQDVWNSAPAWGFNVVPGSSGPATLPILAGGLAQQVAGLGAYVYWNKTLYAELAGYQTADGVFSFMSQGINSERGSQNLIKGVNPYFRLALTKEWGPHNVMVGTSGFLVDQYPDPFGLGANGPTNRVRDFGLDAQYQYLLDPHSITATVAYIREKTHYADGLGGQAGAVDASAGSSAQAPTNSDDTLNMFRAKVSYVYKAKYGGTLSYFNVTGSTNSANQTAAFDPASGSVLTNGTTGPGLNATGNPGTTGRTTEVFWTPIQNARVGVQYTMFSKFNGASDNYDGFGRNARDNNTVFVYVWGAY